MGDLALLKKKKSDLGGDVDYISNLPQSIVEEILTRLPIKEAIRTSILSSKWRYNWITLRKLVFDDRCVTSFSGGGAAVERNLVNFITLTLFSHQGPIHKFKLCTSLLGSHADINLWILFLARSDIKRLILRLEDGAWYKVPTYLFDCKNLTHLELFRCVLELPPNFKIFMCLKTLILGAVRIAREATECLISSCPLLERLDLSNIDALVLNIHAPKLKYLCLEGVFKDIYLESSPSLVAIDITMYMTVKVYKHFKRSSDCNFIKFLGGLPLLERLSGHSFFVRYLNIGYDPGRVYPTYNYLKIIELCEVDFGHVKDILVVLRLIKNSPNLRELHVSFSSVARHAPELDFWENECPSDSSLQQLKVVKMTNIANVSHEMKFIKYLLGYSPALEMMTITPPSYAKYGKHMLIELVRFRRASPRAEIVFSEE